MISVSLRKTQLEWLERWRSCIILLDVWGGQNDYGLQQTNQAWLTSSLEFTPSWLLFVIFDKGLFHNPLFGLPLKGHPHPLQGPWILQRIPFELFNIEKNVSVISSFRIFPFAACAMWFVYEKGFFPSVLSSQLTTLPICTIRWFIMAVQTAKDSGVHNQQINQQHKIHKGWIRCKNEKSNLVTKIANS